MRMAGRVCLSLCAGCWAVGLWSSVMGIGPVADLGTYLTWWPGAGFALLVAALVYVVLESLPGGTVSVDEFHRAVGSDGVPLWSALAAAALSLAWLYRWNTDSTLTGGLAALELFTLGILALTVAGWTAPQVAGTEIPGLPAVLSSDPSLPSGGIEREFSWTTPLVGRWTGYAPLEPYSLAVTIDPDRLHEQQQHPHGLTGAHLPGFAALTPEIVTLASQLRAISERDGLDKVDEVRLVLGFVTDGLPVLDPGGDDRPLYPLETLADKGAGPRARTFLAAALLTALGYRAALLTAPNQLALGVYGANLLSDLFLRLEGEPALYAEITSSGFRCGDMPVALRGLSWQYWPLRRDQMLGDQATEPLSPAHHASTTRV